jgi:hypothetical protein
MHICIHAHTHTLIQIQAHAHTQTRIHTKIHTRTHIHTYTHTHTGSNNTNIAVFVSFATPVGEDTATLLQGLTAGPHFYSDATDTDTAYNSDTVYAPFPVAPPVS